jgi:hypothetical protein
MTRLEIRPDSAPYALDGDRPFVLDLRPITEDLQEQVDRAPVRTGELQGAVIRESVGVFLAFLRFCYVL